MGTRCINCDAPFALFMTVGVAVLQGYAERKLHIGATSDPAHQVRLYIMKVTFPLFESSKQLSADAQLR